MGVWEIWSLAINGFINLQFLQELSRQKPFWDKARLSSLVNKRFDPTVPLVEKLNYFIIALDDRVKFVKQKNASYVVSFTSMP